MGAPHLQLAPLRGEFEGLILRILHPGGGQRQQGADGGLVVDQVDEPGPGGPRKKGNPFRGICGDVLDISECPS